MDSLNHIDFKKLASQQKSIQMKMRLFAFAHFKEGQSRTQIAKYLKVSRTSVSKWVHTFLEEGFAGLQEKPRTGRPAFLTPEQQEQLRQYLKDKAHNPQGDRLTGADIHAYIVQKFSKHYHLDSIYYLLDHMGFSWITSRAISALNRWMSGSRMKPDFASRIQRHGFGHRAEHGLELFGSNSSITPICLAPFTQAEGSVKRLSSLGFVVPWVE
ncbi:helix-turn-helix domain-containing protein [Photobacterium sp. TY1-4]|nr:helix-turn-helix domain-containing protein [Photobacterium sp. TY1-4]UXI01165.1 helix-turn-helix domain-containing protein [Photobacterium sp. TY1-4]